MFIRNERSVKEFYRLYPIVSWIVILNTVLFLLTELVPRSPVFFWGVGSNAHVLNGEYWRLITPIFLHGGVGHYVFNSFSLIIFGPALERILGKGKFIAIYLLTGLIGNIGTLAFGGLSYLHLGASGAIYGLLGCYFYMRFFRKDLIDPGSAQIVTTILILGAAYTIIFSRDINVLAHLFGFIGGTMLAPILLPKGIRRFI